MSLLKLLLSISTICTAVMMYPINKESDIVRHDALDYFLSEYNILPLHYNMELKILDNDFYGNCVITIYIINATQNIHFRVPDSMTRIKSELMPNNNGVIHEKIPIYNSKTSYYYKNNIVMSTYKDVLLPGKYNLNITYQINMIRESFGTSYINVNGNKEWLIATDIQTRKKHIFPFWNKPELKITFNISIIHHRRYKALSNMPIQVSRLVDKDTMQTYFKTALISTDDVAFTVSDFRRISLTKTVTMWCRPQIALQHARFAKHVIEGVATYLENYWNNSGRILTSPESKVDHVAIPNLQDGIKQILGFVFHREADIIYNEELDPVARKMIIAPLVARRMIQKNIGNLLNPPYWFDLWLNKGFIIFFQSYIIDKIMPNFRMMELLIVQVQHELLDFNTYVDINSEIEYENYFENYTKLYTFLSYNKGSIIWHMLERTLLPNKFSKGINIYLKNQDSESMETRDNFWDAMQTVLDELDSEKKFDVRSIVHSWAMQKCFPVLKVMRDNSSDVIITISVQFHNKMDEKQYYIPVTYTTKRNSNFTITWSNMMWLTPSNPKIYLVLDIDQWIISNLQQAGYYRVDYDTENWRKIARYLNSTEYKNIHVLNRAQIIDDAFHFAIEKKLNFSVFWELASYLQKEKDYIAWYPMLKAFEFMSNVFAFLKFYPQFQKVLKPLELTWNVYSKDSNDDHIECLKQELAKWKCVTYDISCRRNASVQLQRHINKAIELSPGWKKWTYCNGLKTANLSFWNKVYQNIMEESDHTILECLLYTEDADIITWSLKRKSPNTLSANSYYHQLELMKVIEQNDTYTANIFLSALVKNTGHMLKNMLDNFRDIVPRHVNEIATLVVIINNVYSKEQLGEVREFIRKEIEGPILSDFERKIETRWSEIERQTEFLQSIFID